jgi:hypothetical protein
MSRSIKAFLPFVAGLLLTGVAQAQLLPTWETHITLTQQDLDMIREAVANRVHGKPVERKLTGAIRLLAIRGPSSWSRN